MILGVIQLFFLQCLVCNIIIKLDRSRDYPVTSSGNSLSSLSCHCFTSFVCGMILLFYQFLIQCFLRFVWWLGCGRCQFFFKRCRITFFCFALAVFILSQVFPVSDIDCSTWDNLVWNGCQLSLLFSPRPISFFQVGMVAVWLCLPCAVVPGLLFLCCSIFAVIPVTYGLFLARCLWRGISEAWSMMVTWSLCVCSRVVEPGLSPFLPVGYCGYRGVLSRNHYWLSGLSLLPSWLALQRLRLCRLNDGGEG